MSLPLPLPLQLPKPIADYVAANARLDIDGMVKAFPARRRLHR